MSNSMPNTNTKNALLKFSLIPKQHYSNSFKFSYKQNLKVNIKVIFTYRLYILF